MTVSSFKKIRCIKNIKKALFLANIFDVKKMKSKLDKTSCYDKF